MSDLYPEGPSNVSNSLTAPTSAYKHRAWWAVSSLILFITLYFALTSWFAWTAYRLLNEAITGSTDQFLNFLISGSAAFLAVFLFKALFFIKRGNNPDDVEITEAEQPRLFAFLNRLADETGAPRPNRVYLSARVNAAVFYDLSILNLILPSKKNLEIGLALINVLTLSETKAVLAHEFGHFAQRSMAIGSWVYIAQQIASQVIAKRDILDRFLKGLSRTDPRIAWVGWILSLIVWSIRSLLDSVLNLVVLAQRALSRQMEFQADLVAVSLTGSDELIHALHKLQAADEAWNRTLSFVNSELNQNRMPHDLFAIQTSIIQKMAHILDDENYGKIPKQEGTQPESRRIFKAGFAQPPQMWSTHPSNADREENSKKTYLAAPHDPRSAWLLFDNVGHVKSSLIKSLVKNIFNSNHEKNVQSSSPEETALALDAFYNLPQFETRYRGAYLGRELTRHTSNPESLYESTKQHLNVKESLASLYAPELSHQFTKLRELEEEVGLLKALHRKAYQATGGRIVYRGREIARRELPNAINEVEKEIDLVTQKILEHDKQCRTAHIEAAKQLNGNWENYLKGLIKLLHYTEHSLADLRDAQGLLDNVLAVVTADGKVSGRELKKLITTANNLHETMSAIDAQKASIHLDKTICNDLKVESWSAMLEEFKLPPASKDNINDWMIHIDSWVESIAYPLNAVKSVTLERLIKTEDLIANHLLKNTQPEAAPAASITPESYTMLLSGQERKRQERLGIWDRFMVADGVVPSVARLLVAGSIVGAVLGFGSFTATNSTVTMYNGLGRNVQVHINHNDYTLLPFSAQHVEVELNEKALIQTTTTEGEVIERFTPAFSGHAQHYVYNVASASPLIEWPAVYGNAPEPATRQLGTVRWTTSNADIFFTTPPESVKTKAGSAIRWVMDGLGERLPESITEGENYSEELKTIARKHIQWDAKNAPNTQIWKKIAN